MKRTFLIGLFFALITFTAAAVLSLTNMAAQRGINDERSNAFATSQKIENLIGGIVDAETAWSNYSKSRDPRALEKYNAAIRETVRRRDELKSIYSGEHVSRRFENLFILVNSRIQILMELLDTASETADPRTKVEILEREEVIHNALIQAAQQLEEKETSEIVALDGRIAMLTKQSISFLLAGTLLCVITFSGLFYRLYRELRERKRLELAIKRQAHYDSLTGLPNRLSFMERLDYEITQAHRSGERLAVLFLDVDRFKDINDSLGHQAGDTLLKEAAQRLRSGIRESDSIARIGGDEFNILLTNIADTSNVSGIVGKLVSSFHPPFMISGQEIHSSSSIGISIYPDDGEDARALLKNADIAMYHAKGQGGNNYKFYNPSLNRRILQRVMMENSLRHTLEKNELLLHFQPRIEIRNNRIVCAEALVRWQHPGKGLLGPRAFIPVAEGMGFIPTVDEWVLRTACAQARAWQERAPALRLAVNVSSRWFTRPGLVKAVSDIAEATGFDPCRLELEISEKDGMEDVDAFAVKLRELQRAGVSVSIDHFGVGPSSLSDLKRLSVSRIKIDRSFIKGIGSSRNDRAMIKAMIVMAHNMGARIAAEGVENREQMRFLEENGCDEAQGYHVCGPVTPEEFERFFMAYEAGWSAA